MNDCQSASPSSDILSDGMDTLSIPDKTGLRKSIPKHNNYKAGYIPVHEQDIQTSNIRGRKTFAFWTLVFLLFILAIGNLILTVVILGVLRLGQGMQSLELIPEDFVLKFMGETDLGNIYKRDGKIEGYANIPVVIVADNGSVVVNLAVKYGRSINKLKIDQNGTIVRNIDEFEVKNADDDTVFSTHSRKYVKYKNVTNISASMVETNRVVSPIGKELILGGENIYFKGAEGTNMESKSLSWDADQDIRFESRSLLINSSAILIVDTVLSKHNEFSKAQYKVCICMPQGKLFKLRLPSTNAKIFCDQVASNPCM
ncbi:hypothetical protein PPYR_04260 [Photinus pyralis]|uniref:Beta-sarcoglycan n=1 Tax=Photinus pyralis TaxID=7054 RepID=A0A1Y1KGD8_PHOPY|nr:beta-sarcoglycan [Photinus pyralis]KAB0802074.1 hypothetical protein PPYR_04260 [Photinus pyralis]